MLSVEPLTMHVMTDASGRWTTATWSRWLKTSVNDIGGRPCDTLER